MPRRSIKFYRKNEAEVMKQLGLRPTPNSGAGWVFKEDGQNEQCICQLKSTDKRSISIKQDDLHILEQNAAVAHKLPVFALQFLNTDEVWVMIKPEDLGLIQSLVEGKDISEQLNFGEDLFCESDSDVDSEGKTEYNINCVGDKNTEKSYRARQAYRKQREKEREQREQGFKQKMKEIRRERRQQKFGKGT